VFQTVNSEEAARARKETVRKRDFSPLLPAQAPACVPGDSVGGQGRGYGIYPPLEPSAPTDSPSNPSGKEEAEKKAKGPATPNGGIPGNPDISALWEITRGRIGVGAKNGRFQALFTPLDPTQVSPDVSAPIALWYTSQSNTDPNGYAVEYPAWTRTFTEWFRGPWDECLVDPTPGSPVTRVCPFGLGVTSTTVEGAEGKRSRKVAVKAFTYRPVRVFFDGPGIDEHLSYAYSPDGGVTWKRYTYLLGHQGTIRAVLDEGGNLQERYLYDPYGRRRIYSADWTPRTATQVHNDSGYTGRTHDPATGLLYYRNRWYHPALGRLLTCDPIGIWGDGGNYGSGYGFCSQNPYRISDPFGSLGQRETLSPVLGVEPLFYEKRKTFFEGLVKQKFWCRSFSCFCCACRGC